MKVLIVDDVEANRTTLKWVLSKTEVMDIKEAASGHEAICACEKDKYDLVFMDVMMSGMTGIEATRAIKKISPNSMIIAVTALDDETTTNEMFLAGAEDYIAKPVKQEVLKARLRIYLKVIENRHLYSLTSESISLFKKPVFNRFTTLKIKEETNLAEFWEYHYGCSNIKNESLCDTVSKIYKIGTLVLATGNKFLIFFEENKDALFFTLNRTSSLEKSIVEDSIRKDGFKGNYLLGSDRLSFMVEKTQISDPVCKHSDDVTLSAFLEKVHQETIDDTQKQADFLLETAGSAQIKIKTEEVLQVYDFIDEHDFEGLEDYIKDLDSVLILFQSSNLESGDVMAISHKLEKIAAILSSYTETYELGMAIRMLAADIKEHINEFIGHKDLVSNMFFSFVRDFLDWFSKIFRTGAPSINFMDDTIIANTLMISNAIKPLSESGNSQELDDMFF